MRRRIFSWPKKEQTETMKQDPASHRKRSPGLWTYVMYRRLSLSRHCPGFSPGAVKIWCLRHLSLCRHVLPKRKNTRFIRNFSKANSFHWGYYPLATKGYAGWLSTAGAKCGWGCGARLARAGLCTARRPSLSRPRQNLSPVAHFTHPLLWVREWGRLPALKENLY